MTGDRGFQIEMALPGDWVHVANLQELCFPGDPTQVDEAEFHHLVEGQSVGDLGLAVGQATECRLGPFALDLGAHHGFGQRGHAVVLGRRDDLVLLRQVEFAVLGSFSALVDATAGSVDRLVDKARASRVPLSHGPGLLGTRCRQILLEQLVDIGSVV